MATLTIPEQFAPWMRIGALRELTDEAKGLNGTTKQTAEDIRKEEFNARHNVGVRQSLEWLVSDTTGSLRSLAAEIPIGLQILEGDSNIEGTPDAHAYMIDSMCRRVVTEELIDLPGPLDAEEEGENHLAAITEALTWAGQETVRLRAICSEQADASRKEATR